jgi:NAD dependent epimerase/dehydratase family
MLDTSIQQRQLEFDLDSSLESLFTKYFMKILITGGAGFIARHLTTLLLARDLQVVCLDSLDPQIHGTISDPQQYLSNSES